ncbi:uncharacterized protein LOC125045333 [Penaeus chinensis]|uniref:uncharacterized protein LOC125045333 n=1 Tax=Penaeus chinensis TaxID=139456 RepID=UPI001FB73B7E|nr:uncharacterized protein LOC125045333 [Penaeus chinensis]
MEYVGCREEEDRTMEKGYRRWGLEISRTITEYLPFNCQDHIENIKVGEVKCVRSFKYLGSDITSSRDRDVELNNRIQSAWANWRRTSGVLYNKKLKGRLYKRVVRPGVMYGAETCLIKKDKERKLEVVEMHTFRWMCEVTKNDRIRNKNIRGTVKVAEISKKLQERRLQCHELTASMCFRGMRGRSNLLRGGRMLRLVNTRYITPEQNYCKRLVFGIDKILKQFSEVKAYD